MTKKLQGPFSSLCTYKNVAYQRIYAFSSLDSTRAIMFVGQDVKKLHVGESIIVNR